MLPAGLRALEPRLPVADGNAFDKPVIDEQFEHAVDARAAGRLALRAERVLDFNRAQSTRLLASRSMILWRAPPCLRPALASTSRTCSLQV